MEALVVLIIGSILIVVLRKMPSKEAQKLKSLPDSIFKLFSGFRKPHAKGDESNKRIDQGISDKKKELLEKAGEFLKNNKFKEAEELYIKVLEIDQKDISSYKGIGQICFKKKDYGHALEVFQKLVELTPRDSANYCNLGMCYFKKKDFKKAQNIYEKAIKIEEKPFYYKNLGITFNALKNYEKAADSLENSLKGNTDKDSIALMTKLLPKIKNKDKSKRILKLLLKLEPENVVLKRDLSRLK